MEKKNWREILSWQIQPEESSRNINKMIAMKASQEIIDDLAIIIPDKVQNQIDPSLGDQIDNIDENVVTKYIKLYLGAYIRHLTREDIFAD
jgi:hypothetical protein